MDYIVRENFINSLNDFRAQLFQVMTGNEQLAQKIEALYDTRIELFGWPIAPTKEPVDVVWVKNEGMYSCNDAGEWIFRPDDIYFASICSQWTTFVVEEWMRQPVKFIQLADGLENYRKQFFTTVD